EDGRLVRDRRPFGDREELADVALADARWRVDRDRQRVHGQTQRFTRFVPGRKSPSNEECPSTLPIRLERASTSRSRRFAGRAPELGQNASNQTGVAFRKLDVGTFLVKTVPVVALFRFVKWIGRGWT